MKIAIMGAIHEDGLKELEKANFQCFEVCNFEEKNLKNELQNVDGILLRTAKLNSNILSICNNLKIVSRHGVGYDNVDINFCALIKFILLSLPSHTSTSLIN